MMTERTLLTLLYALHTWSQRSDLSAEQQRRAREARKEVIQEVARIERERKVFENSFFGRSKR